MAGIQLRHGSYRVLFRYQGKQHAFTLGEVSSHEAANKAAQVEYLLMRLDQRLASVPAGMDIVDYVQFDGKEPLPDKPPPVATKLTLRQLRKQYIATHEKSLEANSVATIQMHFRHLVGHFGEAFSLSELSLADLQGYVDARAQATGKHGRTLTAATIEKEIVSLRTAWNWGLTMGLVTGKFPNKGLCYPKNG